MKATSALIAWNNAVLCIHTQYINQFFVCPKSSLYSLFKWLWRVSLPHTLEWVWRERTSTFWLTENNIVFIVLFYFKQLHSHSCFCCSMRSFSLYISWTLENRAIVTLSEFFIWLNKGPKNTFLVYCCKFL